MYLLLPSRHLNRATSAIKCVFLSDTPFHHTQLSHVLFQLRLLELSKGKGRHIHKHYYHVLVIFGHNDMQVVHLLMQRIAVALVQCMCVGYKL